MLSNCRITDAGIRFLATHCQNLLEVSACNSTITDEGIKALLMECRYLRLLNIQGTNIGNVTLSYVGTYARALSALLIQDCATVGFRL